MRRKRLLLRAGPLVAASVVAFGVGMVVASGSPDRDAVQRFGEAWERQDFAAMYAELSPSARADYSPEAMEQAYRDAEATATFESVEIGELRGPLEQSGETVIAMPTNVTTSSFGSVERRDRGARSPTARSTGGPTSSSPASPRATS